MYELEPDDTKENYNTFVEWKMKGKKRKFWNLVREETMKKRKF